MTDPYKGRYCKDCRHCVGEHVFFTFPSPMRRTTGCSKGGDFIDPVFGPRKTVKPCYGMRGKWFGKCGPEGKLWEPVDPTPETD